MGIYIKGMEMPTGNDELRLIIHSNGQVIISHQTYYEEAEAVPVPPHGRLIEESKVLDIVSEWCPDDDGSVGKYGDLREMLDEIEAIPTIIPASEEVYDKYTDTAGNLHWTGTYSGEHIIQLEVIDG